MVFLSPVLRLSTAAIRVLFYVWLASVGNVELVADLAIVNAALGLYVFLLPFDYYISLQKEYQSSSLEGSKAFYNHILFVAMVSIALFIVVAGFLAASFVSMLVFSVFVLFSVEVFNTEINRLLILRGKVGFSSLMMFIRNGAFPLVIVALHFLEVNYGVQLVVSIWLLFSLSALATCLAVFRVSGHMRMLEMTKQFCSKEMKVRIQAGAKNILSTLFVRLHFSMDKYCVLWFFDKKTLGYYQVSLSIVSAYVILVDSIVVPSQYRLFFSDGQEKGQLYRRYYGSVILVFLVFFGALSGLHFTVEQFAIDIDIAGLDVTAWLLMAQLSFVFGYAPTYLLVRNGLYHLNSLASLFSLISFTFLALCVWGLGLSVAWLAFSFFCSFTAGFVAKYVMVERFENKLVI